MGSLDTNVEGVEAVLSSPVSSPVSTIFSHGPSTMMEIDENTVSTYDIEHHAGRDVCGKTEPTIWSRLALWGSSRCRSSIEKSEKQNRLRVRSLESCPRGYPRLAAFLSSDPNFMLYRSFSYLRARLLLSQQYDLVELETELDGMDKAQNETKASRRHLLSMAFDKKHTKDKTCERNGGEREAGRTRIDILADIKQKLQEYDDLLLKSREVESLQRPSDRDYKSVRQWMTDVQPLISREMEYFECKEDIVTMRTGRECAGFDGFIESALQKLDCKFIRYLFLTPELRQKTSDKHIHYYSPSRVDTLVGLIITAVIFVLLILPVVAMYQLTAFGNRNNTFHAIGVLIVFTLLFGAAMSVLTRARRHELFAASAAYCAVLVVFISNFGGTLS